MDYVFIEGLKVSGKHGVMDIERKVEQEFEISTKLYFAPNGAATSDNLEDALDYFPIKEKMIQTIQTNSFYLIERLAETLCQEILENKKVQKVELTIRKTAVWDNGVPGITIARENK